MQISIPISYHLCTNMYANKIDWNKHSEIGYYKSSEQGLFIVTITLISIGLWTVKIIQTKTL